MADGELAAELQEALLADALHVHQLLHLLERSVFLAVFDDARGHLLADAGQLLELRGGRRIEVDGGWSWLGLGTSRSRLLGGLCRGMRGEEGGERERCEQTKHAD